MAVLVHFIRNSHPNALVDCVTQLHFDIITLAGDPDIGLTKFAKKEQGMSSLLAQGQSKRVLFTALIQRRLHVS